MATKIYNQNPHSNTLFERYMKQSIILLLVLSGALLAYWLSSDVGIILGILLIFFAVFIFLRFFKLNNSLNKNERGSDAEKEVSKILGELSDRYTIFHNVLIKPGLDIDLVLVGPKGVFAIEVKSHKNINSDSWKKFINQAFAEAKSLKEYLKQNQIDVYVQSVLVYSRVKINFKPEYNIVKVINKQDLLRLIDGTPTPSFDIVKTQELIKKLY